MLHSCCAGGGPGGLPPERFESPAWAFASRSPQRAYGKFSLIFLASLSDRWSVPRSPRFCLGVFPNVARWRLPARRNFTAPLFFTWKRFLAALLVLSFGIFFVLLWCGARRRRRRCRFRRRPGAAGARRAPPRERRWPWRLRQRPTWPCRAGTAPC